MLSFATKVIVRLVRDQKGVTAVEYAILGAALVTAIGTATSGFGTALAGAFTNILN
jgi:pilus assembly protein Flp/PilA